MMSEKNSPVRMCIICKSRLLKSSLYRFQIKEGILVPFSDNGRSFYICEACLDGNQQRLIRTINHKFNLKLPNVLAYGEILKETATNG